MKRGLSTFWQNKCSTYFKDSKFALSFIAAIIFLIVSLFVNFYSGEYATHYQSNSVTDLILSNIRVYDLDGLFVYGSLVFIAFIVILCIWEPKRIPFTVKSIALFTIIRSVFVTLTHIGTFPGHVIIDPASFISKFTFGGDLFFSGHTGLPFLLALIFWKHKLFRYIFLATSLGFGVVVLLAHLHYSIDVLGAFFITFSIYHICEKFFSKDRAYFNS